MSKSLVSSCGVKIEIDKLRVTSRVLTDVGNVWVIHGRVGDTTKDAYVAHSGELLVQSFFGGNFPKDKVIYQTKECAMQALEKLKKGENIMAKFKVGDRVKVNVGCTTEYGTPYFNPLMGEFEGTTQVVSEVTNEGGVRLLGVRSDTDEWVWSPSWLTLDKVVTKEEWIAGLLAGKTGTQSGNTAQRWRYVDGVFESKYNSGWKKAEINSLDGCRTYGFVEGVEMTIAEIEKALGVTNLKIVK